MHDSLLHSGLEHGNCLNSDNADGSAATRLRCGATVNEDFVAYLLVNLALKEL